MTGGETPSSVRVCPSCGRENWFGAIACADCGALVVDIVPTAPATAGETRTLRISPLLYLGIVVAIVMLVIVPVLVLMAGKTAHH